MRKHISSVTRIGAATIVCLTVSAGLSAGCQTTSAPAIGEWTVRDAVERYSARRSDQADSLPFPRDAHTPPFPCHGGAWPGNDGAPAAEYAFAPFRRATSLPLDAGVFTLGTFGDENVPAAGSPSTQQAERAAPAFTPPEGYWRKNIWHQMGHEAKQLGGHDFWKGFKTSFWDLENALVFTATMGASVTIRETGVDDTIRSRTRGHRQLGDMDETIQILGHPGTHFAATGVLWLTSTLTEDVKQHEVAKSLTQALAVNGVSTLLLKAATNTRAPNGERHAWPSGHTSSAFAAAAVLNEYYGPWVGVPSLALAGLVGYQRIDSRVHDFSDVVFGGMLGYVIGTSIAREEKAQFPELFGMQVIPFIDPETGSTGLALHKRW